MKLCEVLEHPGKSCGCCSLLYNNGGGAKNCRSQRLLFRHGLKWDDGGVVAGGMVLIKTRWAGGSGAPLVERIVGCNARRGLRLLGTNEGWCSVGDMHGKHMDFFQTMCFGGDVDGSGV